MVKNVTQLAIAKAVQKVGSRTRVAEAFKISRQAMDQWDLCPPKHVLTLERLSGVSRYELRPDIYGSPPVESGRVRPKTRVQRPCQPAA